MYPERILSAITTFPGSEIDSFYLEIPELDERMV
jgi:hypothetical protein